MISLQKFREYIQTPKENGVFMSNPTQYYLRNFQHYPLKKFFLSWNWAAFFATLYGEGHVWLAYRRMYWAAGLLWTLQTGFSVILVNYIYPLFPKILSNLPPIMQLLICSRIFVCISCCIMGMIGNSLYFLHVRKAIAQNSSMKGTDVFGALIAILVSAIPAFLLFHWGFLPSIRI